MKSEILNHNYRVINNAPAGFAIQQTFPKKAGITNPPEHFVSFTFYHYRNKKGKPMDALSNLFGWLTGTWTKQNSIGKAFLGCAVLLIMACLCGVPLLIISLMDM